MKILYLSPGGLLGGAERCLLTIMAAVKHARPDAQLELLCASDGPLLAHAAAIGARVTLIPMPAEMAKLGDSSLSDSMGREPALLMLRSLLALPATRRFLAQLRKAVAESNPDLIHSNGLKTHLLSALLPRRSAPIVWHVHDFLASRPAMSRLLRLASFRCAGAIAISKAIALDARSILGSTPVRVVYNAIDINHFTPAPDGVGEGAPDSISQAANSDGDFADLDRLSGMESALPGTVRVGLVATYARWKGQDLVLETAARCFAENPRLRTRFYIVGGPIYQTRNSQFTEASLRRHAERLKLGPHVGFIGFQEDPLPIYRALDIVVHASTRPEPFGLTVAEAMSCGRAVIIARAGGVAELFTPEFDAIGVPPGNAPALATAIRRLACSSDRRLELGQNARITAVNRFHPQRLGREIIDWYEAVLIKNEALYGEKQVIDTFC
jgi:glycosyltransferase involved in cell wall biosynthesis